MEKSVTVAEPAATRQPRRGPAPFASFDHDVSDESSPESKQTFQLPEIREVPASSSPVTSTTYLIVGVQRERSLSTPGVYSENASGLQTPATPRIDISRASSSSHHDSRDSSPEMALFTGSQDNSKGHLELGFREDGAADLRSSTEELAFLEGAPGEPKQPPLPVGPIGSVSRRHSRKDSQGSEAAFLGISGRTSRLSSIGSQCSALSIHSAISGLSRASYLSVVSGVSRSPSPHKMLLETSFCGPRPIETDPEICAAAVEERLLEIVKSGSTKVSSAVVDDRDRREVEADVTVEIFTSTSSITHQTSPTVTKIPTVSTNLSKIERIEAQIESVSELLGTSIPDEEKRQKEEKNKVKAGGRSGRTRDRYDQSTRTVSSKSKDIIRIKLKPSEEYDDDENGSEEESGCTIIGVESMCKPVTLELSAHAMPSPTLSHRRTPSPCGASTSRKSSFCSLFKSRETITSPDSPSGVLRRKKSLNEGRSRSKSRDRSGTPTSTAKIKGSVLALFKTPRKSITPSSPNTRDGSPNLVPLRQIDHIHVEHKKGLKYYEESNIIHIPLRTPPEEGPELNGSKRRSEPEVDSRLVELITHVPPERERPATAPILRTRPEEIMPSLDKKPIKRTVLPDGSIIIPLHSPTEKIADFCLQNEKAHLPADVTPGQNQLKSQEIENKSNFQIKAEINNECNKTDAVMSTIIDHKQSSVNNEESRKKKERILFSTHVGSKEQLFSTQFSITKTPSVTSEISGSFPSFTEDLKQTLLRDTHITSEKSPSSTEIGVEIPASNQTNKKGYITNETSEVASSVEDRDSSESEPSVAIQSTRNDYDVEQRGLVVQESFEEELPYVPTTLPQERSVALPMVPVRERRGAPIRTATVQRPRPPAAHSQPPPPPETSGQMVSGCPTPAPLAAPVRLTHPVAPVQEKIRIRLPRRARASSAGAMHSRPERSRTISAGEGSEVRLKQDWIDFEEVPEKRKQPKRIQTLPSATNIPMRDGMQEDESMKSPEGVVFSYVEPEECRCECHSQLQPRPDDELPLLDDTRQMRISSSSVEGEVYGEETHARLCLEVARPYTADFCTQKPPSTGL